MKKNKSIVLTVPQPCSESWDKMTPEGKGRVCSKCNKALTDFTEYTDRQLLDYISNYNGTICGKFSPYQLNRQVTSYETSGSSFLQRLFVGSALATSLAACNGGEKNHSNQPTSQQLPNEKTDSEKQETTSTDTGSNYIGGRVLDFNKSPITSTKVTIKGINLSTYTDTNGSFRIHVSDNLIGKEVMLEFSPPGRLGEVIPYKIDKLPFNKEVKMDSTEPVVLGVMTPLPNAHFPGSDDSTTIYTNPTTKPTYKNLSDYLSKNIEYPDEMVKEGIHGTVYLSFVIEKSGAISNVKVLRGVHPMLDSEAVRVVRSMPKWVPGKQNGKRVRVQYMIPIKFTLSDDSTKDKETN